MKLLKITTALALILSLSGCTIIRINTADTVVKERPSLLKKLP